MICRSLLRCKSSNFGVVNRVQFAFHNCKVHWCNNLLKDAIISGVSFKRVFILLLVSKQLDLYIIYNIYISINLTVMPCSHLT